MSSRGSLPYDHYHHCKRLGSRDDHLPPTMPNGSSSIPAQCHVWLAFVVSSRLAPKVFPGCSGFPPLTKTNISKFQFDQGRGPAWKPAKADVASSLNIVFVLLFLLFYFIFFNLFFSSFALLQGQLCHLTSEACQSVKFSKKKNDNIDTEIRRRETGRASGWHEAYRSHHLIVFVVHY